MIAPRFVALTGEPQDLKGLLTRLVPSGKPPQRLNRTFDSPELVIFASPETPQLTLADGHGLLLGKLFRGGEREKALGSEASQQAARSGGASLLDGTWGPFASFTRYEGRVSALRDPSAAVPVYFRQTAGITIYFSDLELTRDFNPADAGVDEAFLRQWLTFPFLRSARTGITGIEELLPGTVRRTGRGEAEVLVAWSPWPAAAEPIMSFDEAAEQLHSTLLRTIACQLEGENGLALELSGGLDSAVVAAALAERGIRLPAVNFATRSADGDERHYARTIAERLGLALEEVEEDEAPLDFSPAGLALRPPLSPVVQPLNRALSAYARRTGVRGLVTGAGGDNLFCYVATAAPILDAVRDRGFLRAVRTTLPDVAALGGCTVWTAARYALRKRLTLRRRPLWRRDERFLAPAAIAERPDPHPWLEARPDIPPGKREHVASLVRAQYFLGPRQGSGEALVHPLFNQPLMELCLAIPTWLSVRNGQNRAVARNAFEGLLPKTIIQRRSKGRLESMCARAFENNRHSLRQLLLEGELASRRLVDLPAIARYMKGSGPAPDEAYFRLFDLAALEIWLRSWRR